MSSALFLEPNVERSLKNGQHIAYKNKHEFFTMDHWALGILELDETIAMLNDMHIDVADLKRKITENIKKTTKDLNNPSNVKFSPNRNFNNKEIDNGEEEKEEEKLSTPSWTNSISRVLINANKLAKIHNMGAISLWMVMMNILEEKDSFTAYCFKESGLSQLKIKYYIGGHRDFSALENASDGITGIANPNNDVKPSTQEDMGGSPSFLKTFGTNLNELAKNNKIDPLIGRSFEIQRTAQILGRRRKNNPLLVGEPGVGKTAIAEGLAKLIVDKEAPNTLKDKQIWSLDMGSLLAGTKYRGDFEKRIKGIVDETKGNENIILFIDEIHTMIGAGASGSSAMDASNIIKPALSSGQIRLIGSTTFSEYREIFEKEKALDRRFQKIDVLEPSPSETVDILKGLKKVLEKHHDVRYTKTALKVAVDLSVKYMPDRCLPDKAIDILDEAGSSEKMKPDSVRRRFIDDTSIMETVARITKLPVAKISKTEKDNLSNLSDDLKNVIFGQDTAIDTLSDAVCISKAGLNNEEKPMGSFLFAGPTGVGKTEIARQLSKKMEIPLLRFDMSEYTEAHSISRLIGSPPGYVGHDKGGLLTDEVYKNPHCILLLDEIEKAHPDIYNVLLQMLDYGTLTDSNGRKVNFKNTFILMTTNSGAQVASKRSIGFVKSDNKSEGQKVLNNNFPPEFRNRLDAIIYFNSLGHKEVIKVVDKNLDMLAKTLKSKSIDFSVSQDVKDKLAEEGYSAEMGARPMERVIQEKIKKPLSKKMLFGDLSKGGKVNVDFCDGDFVWEIKKLSNKSIKKKSQKVQSNTPKTVKM